MVLDDAFDIHARQFQVLAEPGEHIDEGMLFLGHVFSSRSPSPGNQKKGKGKPRRVNPE
jgi:hypothetical protein